MSRFSVIQAIVNQGGLNQRQLDLASNLFNLTWFNLFREKEQRNPPLTEEEVFDTTYFSPTMLFCHFFPPLPWILQMNANVALWLLDV